MEGHNISRGGGRKLYPTCALKTQRYVADFVLMATWLSVGYTFNLSGAISLGNNYAKSHEYQSSSWIQVENQQKYLKCKNTATGGVNKLHFDAASPDGYFANLCEVMRAYLDCSRPIIITRCGREAWDLVTRVRTTSRLIALRDITPRHFLQNLLEKIIFIV